MRKALFFLILLPSILVATTAHRINTDLIVGGYISSRNEVSPAAYGAVCDGVTDDWAAFALAMAVLPSGGKLSVGEGDCYLSDNLTVSVENVTISGQGYATTLSFANGKGIVATASGFTLRSISINGGTYTTHTSNSAGVYVHGTDASNYISNVKIEDCYFTQMPFYGIKAQFVDGITVSKNRIEYVANAGIAALSVRNLTVSDNHVSNINADSYFSNAWGIIISELQVADGASYTGAVTSGSSTVTVTSATSLVAGQVIVSSYFPVGTTVTSVVGTTLTVSEKATGTNASATLYFNQPRTVGFSVVGNLVRDNVLWEGIDVHSGIRGTISGNTVLNSRSGIVVGDSGTLYGMAPQSIVISSNTIKGYSGNDPRMTCTGSSLNVTLASAPNFTVLPGNYILFGSQTRLIATVTDQTHFVLDNTGGSNSGAFSPQPSAESCTVTQYGYNKYGIAFTGDSGTLGTPDQLADGTIVGNSVSYYGNEEESLAGSIYVHTATGSVSGNSVIEPNGYCFLLYHDIFGMSVNGGNTCTDPWSYSKTDPSFLSFGSDYVYANVSDNVIRRGSKSAGTVLAYGIRWAGGTTHFKTPIGNHIYEGTAGTFLTNIPTGQFQTAALRFPQSYSATSAPSTGTWANGEIVWNSGASSPTDPAGWKQVGTGSANFIAFGGNQAPAGNVTTPSLNFNGAGLYDRGSHQVGFTANGVLQGLFDETQWILGADNTTPVSFTGLSLQFNSATTSAAEAVIKNNVNDGSMVYSGGNSATAGANVRLFGGTHATLPNVTQFRKGSTVQASIDASGNLNIDGLTASTILRSDSSKNVASLANGSNGQVLAMVSGSPAWATVGADQEPAHTGDVTNSAGSLATTVAAIQGTTVSGTTGSGNVVFSAAPTLTGAVAGGATLYTTGQMAVGNTSVLGDYYLRVGHGNAVSGSAATQYGIYSDPKVSTSGTTAFHGFYSSPRLAASTNTGVISKFTAGAVTAGTGTATRTVAYYTNTNETLGSTGNCIGLCDNVAFSGNWFINQSGTLASSFGGAVTVNGQFIGKGTATNDSASAGYIGEVASVSRLASAATSVTTGTALNVTASALSLTAGDWDVSGSLCFTPAATTSVTMLTAAVSLTSATLPAADTVGVPTSGEYQNVQNLQASVPAGVVCLTVPPVRESVSGTTSVYLVGKSTFTVSTMTAHGSLTARRVR